MTPPYSGSFQPKKHRRGPPVLLFRKSIGSSGSISKCWQREILAQPKESKAKEYFVYFELWILHGWGKRSAASRR